MKRLIPIISILALTAALAARQAPAINVTNAMILNPPPDSWPTYFGDYSRTGVNVITMPGVKIGAYSCVGAGIVVYEDIPSRTLTLLKQETVTRPWGPERYGW